MDLLIGLAPAIIAIADGATHALAFAGGAFLVLLLFGWRALFPREGAATRSRKAALWASERQAELEREMSRNAMKNVVE